MSPDLRSVPSRLISRNLFQVHSLESERWSHLKQNRNGFQINIQRLESVRVGKKWCICLLKKLACR